MKIFLIKKIKFLVTTLMLYVFWGSQMYAQTYTVQGYGSYCPAPSTDCTNVPGIPINVQNNYIGSYIDTYVSINGANATWTTYRCSGANLTSVYAYSVREVICSSTSNNIGGVSGLNYSGSQVTLTVNLNNVTGWTTGTSKSFYFLMQRNPGAPPYSFYRTCYVTILKSSSCNLMMSANNPTPASCGNNNGVISASAWNGNGSYQFSLNNNWNWQWGNTFSGLATGNYTVYAKDGNNCQTSYSVYVGSNGTSTPSTPINVNATDGNCGSVLITCSPVNGATMYYFYRNGIQIGTNSNPSYSDYNAPANATPYTVIAQNSCGTSVQSSPNTGYQSIIPPSCSTPTGLSATTTTTTANLSWSSVAGVSNYTLFYKTVAAGNYTQVTVWTNGYTLSGLVPNTQYQWYVVANCNCGVVSGASVLSTLSTQPLCGTPTNLVSSNIQATSATIGWTTVNSAISYNVQYRVQGSNTWINAPSTPTNSLVLSGLTASTTYEFQVSATCSAGAGVYSGVGGVTTTGGTISCTGCNEYISSIVIPRNGAELIATKPHFEWEYELGRNIAYCIIEVMESTGINMWSSPLTINGNVSNTVYPIINSSMFTFDVIGAGLNTYKLHKWKVTSYNVSNQPITCFEKQFKTYPGPYTLSDITCDANNAHIDFGTALGSLDGVPIFKNGGCKNTPNQNTYDPTSDNIDAKLYDGALPPNQIYFYEYGWQCVEFARRYYKTIYGMNIKEGAGADHGSNHYNVAGRRAGFKQYTNGVDTVKPRKRDIISFSNPYFDNAKQEWKDFGHVAIIRDVQLTSPNHYQVFLAEQNMGDNVNSHLNYPLEMTKDANGKYHISTAGKGWKECRGWIRATPTLISPGSSIAIPTINTTTPVFTFEEHPNIDSFIIYIKEKDMNNCYNLIPNGRIAISGNNTAGINIPSLTAGSTYKWRVFAEYNNGTDVPSIPYYFMVSNSATPTGGGFNVNPLTHYSSLNIKSLGSLLLGTEFYLKSDTNWHYLGNTNESGYIKSDIRGLFQMGDSIKLKRDGYETMVLAIDSDILAKKGMKLPMVKKSATALCPQLEIPSGLYVSQDSIIQVKIKGSNILGYAVIHAPEGYPDQFYGSNDTLINVVLPDTNVNYLRFAFYNATDTVVVDKRIYYLPTSLNATYNVNINNATGQNLKLFINDEYVKTISNNAIIKVPNQENTIRISDNGILDTSYVVSATTTITLNPTQRAIYNVSKVLTNFITDSTQYASASMTLKYKGNASITVSRTPQNIPLLYTPLSWETFKVTKSVNDALPIQLLAVIDQPINFNAANTSVLLKRNGNYTEIQVAQFGDSIVFEAEEQLLKLYKLRHNDEVTLIQKSLPPLPVELLYLTAKSDQNQYINLSWATATESNSSHFEVERSTDALHFTKINAVLAAGNSNSLKYYQTNDYEVPIGIPVYYRLKMVDTDASFSYSNTANAILSLSDSKVITIYPNPVDDKLTIEMIIAVESDITLSLFNQLGQNVITETVSTHTGNQKLEIDISNLSEGSYTLKVSQEGKNLGITNIIKN